MKYGVLLVLLLSSAPFADPDFDKTQLAARQGDVAAQLSLAIKYEKGDGVSENYEEAVKWFRKAADQGNAQAQYNLGTMYFAGQGVVQDDSKAISWYLKAANQGH